ncbi:DUF1178 family protein [Salinarimonas soli]|uniref:DUF1178 family protein n=1 Tax=Salinarimonas soli TaxID=1638099 RepID=A0A5B2V899_9HYPH|nr:DUF1178 family protein [Salinarimonas soli]KAA2235036.1 DUF1178 family protein [Salinarimonas soli]
MIRYALACDQAHAFESWFPSAAAFDAQAARDLVSCPVCGSARVEKQIMAPSIGRRDKAEAQPAAMAAPQPDPPQPLALLSEPERALRALIAAVREHVTKTAENVGERFADEARKIHYGEADERSIYGQASPDEVRALLDEGVEIQPLPVTPDDRN